MPNLNCNSIERKLPSKMYTNKRQLSHVACNTIRVLITVLKAKEEVSIQKWELGYMEVIHLSQNALKWEEAHAFQVVHAVTVTSLLLDVVKAACFH